MGRNKNDLARPVYQLQVRLLRYALLRRHCLWLAQPAPNHGFLVSLPDVGKASEASVSDPRFLWVNAEYNMSESHSLRGVADYELNLTSSDKAALRIAERKSTTLGGIAAVRLRSNTVARVAA